MYNSPPTNICQSLLYLMRYYLSCQRVFACLDMKGLMSCPGRLDSSSLMYQSRCPPVEVGHVDETRHWAGRGDQRLITLAIP